jgi:WD40 repeat protein
VLLILAVVGIGVAVVYSLSGTRDIPAAEWQTFTVPNGGATVSMPGTPVRTNMPGNPNLNKYLLQRTSDRKGFLIAFWDLPANVPAENFLQQSWAAERNLLVQTLNASVVAERPTKIKGHPGREAEFQIQGPPSEIVVVKLYCVRIGPNYRFYELMASGPRMKADGPDVTTFFDSFQIDAGEFQPEPVKPPPPPPSPLGPATTPEEIGVLRAHSQNVWGLAFTPDGKTLFSGSGEGSLKRWQVDPWKEEYNVVDHPGGIGGLAISRDGARIAVFAGNTVYLCNALSKRETSFPVLWNGKEAASFVTSLAFSADGKTLAVGVLRTNPRPSPGEIQLWDLPAGKEARVVVPAHSDGVFALAYSPDGKTLASAGTDQVKLWDAKTMHERETLEGHVGEVRAVVFAPNGKVIASACTDRTIRLWDAVDGRLLKVLEGHTDRVTKLAFSPNSMTLVSGDGQGTLRIWNTQTGAEQTSLVPCFGQEIRSLAFRPNGAMLTAGMWNGEVKVWDTEKLLKKNTPEPPSPNQTPRGPDEVASFNPTNSLGGSVLQFTTAKAMLTGGDDGVLRMWESAGFKLQATFPAHAGPIISLAASKDGCYLATATNGNLIYLRHGTTGRLERTFKVVLEGAASARVNSLAFTSDGRTLAVGFGNTVNTNTGQIALWDLESFQEVRRTKPNAAEGLLALAFSPNGKTLVSAGNALKVWDTQSLEERRTLKAHLGPVNDLVFSPEGTTLATAGYDRKICLWDQDGELKRSLEGHAQPGISLAFSPDGKWLASGSREGSVCVWDPATGSKKTIWRSDGQLVMMRLAFSPDSKLLAASLGQQVKVWDFDKRLKAPPVLPPANTVRDAQKPELIAQIKFTGNQVARLRFSPNGATLAVGHGDGSLKLYEAAEFRERESLAGQVSAVFTIDYSRDGKKMAVDNPPLIRVRDGVSGQLEIALNDARCDQTEVREGNAFALSPDGKTLAVRVGGWRNPQAEVQFWDLATAKLSGKFRPHERVFRAMAYSPDGATLATAGDDAAKLWDMETQKVRFVLDGQIGDVSTVAFSPDGKMVATGGFDRLIRLWEAATGKPVRTLENHRANILDVSFSPDGKLLASTGNDGNVHLWETASGDLKAVVKGRPGDNFAIASFGAGGKVLATASLNDGVRVWDVAKLIASWKADPPPDGPTKDPKRPELVAGWKANGAVKAVCFAPEGKSLSVLGGDGVLRFYDVPGFTQRAALPGHLANFGGVAAGTRDGKKWAVAFGPNVYLRDGVTGQYEYAFRPIRKGGEITTITALAFSPDGKTLAVRLIWPKPPNATDQQQRGEIYLWDVEARKTTANALVAGGQTVGLVYSPDGTALAAGGAEGLNLLDPATLKPVRAVGEKGLVVHALSFSADGKTLLCAGNAANVLLFEVETGKQTGKLGNVPQGIAAMAVSPDGKLVAVGSPAGAVQLLEADSGKERNILPPDSFWPVLAFSPDGKFLTATPTGGKVEVFAVEKLLERPAK